MLLSPAAAGWQKINPSESKLQILNEDQEFPHECFAKGWSAGKSSRSWGCKSDRNADEAYLIIFQELAPGTAFGEVYTIQQLNKNRKIFQNSRFGSRTVIKTDQTAFEAYQSSRSDRNCYAFKNQDAANYGDNELNGRWLISGYFCHRASDDFKLRRLETFINRISIDGLFRGRYTLISPSTNQPKKREAKARATNEAQNNQAQKKFVPYLKKFSWAELCDSISKFPDWHDAHRHAKAELRYRGLICNGAAASPENNSTVKADAQSLEQELTKLKGFFDQGLIPKSVYNRKVNQLLNSD